jgi:hypothetical protein
MQEADMTATLQNRPLSPSTLTERLAGLVGAVHARLHPAEARALRRAGRLHRLVGWWLLPLGQAGSATEAATRLEILSRGGFPR